MGLNIFLYKVRKPQYLKPGKMYVKDKILQDHKELKITGVEENIPESIKANSIPISLKYYQLSSSKLIKFFKCDEAVGVRVYGTINGELLVYLIDKFGRHFERKIEIPDDVSEEDLMKIANIKIKSMYAYCLDEVAYQRKMLSHNDEWDLVLRECKYNDDYDEIEKMVRYRGLNKEFIDKWEEGKTVFKVLLQ